MNTDQTPRFGRVQYSPGRFASLVSLLLLTFSLSILIRGPETEAATVMGLISGATVILANTPLIMRIPAISTDEEGITLRNATGSGRVFVKWEDAEGVIIWYQRLGGNRSTMIAIATRDDFKYDNYGRHRPIHPARTSYPSQVKRRFRDWSVSAGGTSARKIAKLVSASGKGITVAEETPRGDIRYHTDPQ